jgi:maltooligosyltrehalose trehalohydrolase
VIDGRRDIMEPTGRGWWHHSAVAAGPGTRYAFALDGGAPLPDPRSPSQPEGVHGPSEVVDHATFPWHDEAWRGLSVRGALLYELHVGTFSAAGTFDGVIDRLPHLVDLGVDAIELMPVAEFPGRRGWGYDGVDLFAAHHAYGGPDGLKRLVDACHQVGLGVVLDVVYNHLGPAGNYLPRFGPYFTEQHRTNWGSAVNFDGPESREVRRFVIDNATMWLRDFHIDGLRLDAVHAIVDHSAMHILEELAIEVAALACHLRRPAFLIAENDRNDTRLVRSRDAGGYGLDAAWADEWHHALHTVLTGERVGYYEDFGSMAALGTALRQAWVYAGTWSPHRRHVHGRTPTGLDGSRFVVSTQNHDQIGNRAAGERLSALTTLGRCKVAAALLLTGPFTPLLFQGEEWAASTPFQYFTDHEDPELGRAVSDGRRREFAAFGWPPDEVPDPQAAATFARSRLAWDETGRPPHAEMLDWYRTLIRLRREHPELTDPRLEAVEVVVSEPTASLEVRRGRITVTAALSQDSVKVPVPAGARLLAASEPSVHWEGHAVTLPPDTVAIIERTDP